MSGTGHGGGVRGAHNSTKEHFSNLFHIFVKIVTCICKMANGGVKDGHNSVKEHLSKMLDIFLLLEIHFLYIKMAIIIIFVTLL